MRSGPFARGTDSRNADAYGDEAVVAADRLNSAASDEEEQPEPELGSRSLCCPKQRSHAAGEKDVAVPPRP
jgi:hypothetical protein